MRDFEEIRREEVLNELVNGFEIFAFVLKVDSRKAVTDLSYKLRNEKIVVIQNLIANPNAVFFKKKEEVIA